MGGGAAMRVASRLAKIGSYRGYANETPPVASSVATQQSIASSTSNAQLGASIGKVEQPFHAVPAPGWELDDWEFDGEELVADKYSSSSSPRVVFGSVPTVEEAKAATEELKEALDKIYLESPVKSSAGSEEGSTSSVGQEENEAVNSKICIVPAESSIVPTVPSQALEAFKILREKPAVQGVVASIASDPKIWHAVMQNKAFVEYCQSAESSIGYEKPPSVNNSDEATSSPSSVDGRETPASKAEPSLEDLIEKVKAEVFGIANNVKVEAVGIAKTVKAEVAVIANNVVDFFQDLFGNSKKKTTAPESTAESIPNGVFAIGGSIMGLVMMVIMVLAMKRA